MTPGMWHWCCCGGGIGRLLVYATSTASSKALIQYNTNGDIITSRVLPGGHGGSCCYTSGGKMRGAFVSGDSIYIIRELTGGYWDTLIYGSGYTGSMVPGQWGLSHIGNKLNCITVANTYVTDVILSIDDSPQAIGTPSTDGSSGVCYTGLERPVVATAGPTQLKSHRWDGITWLTTVQSSTIASEDQYIPLTTNTGTVRFVYAYQNLYLGQICINMDNYSGTLIRTLSNPTNAGYSFDAAIDDNNVIHMIVTADSKVYYVAYDFATNSSTETELDTAPSMLDRVAIAVSADRQPYVVVSSSTGLVLHYTVGANYPGTTGTWYTVNLESTIGGVLYTMAHDCALSGGYQRSGIQDNT